MKIFLKNIFTDKKINSRQKAEYLLIISKLLKNGFSLNESINCLRLLNENNSTFSKIYNDLCRGEMISQALRHFDLPAVVHNQLIIAQNHGRLGVALEQTGLLLQIQAKQKNKFKELLAYPSFILAFLITMLIGMKVYIVPQLEVSGGGQAIDIFLKSILGGLLVASLTVGFLVVRVRQKIEYQRAKFLVKLPIVGKLYLNFFQFLILQGLGMQMASGMNLFNICESNNQFQTGSIQGYLAGKFMEGLIQGQSLLQLIETEILLPKQLKVILQAGESGAALAQDLLLMSELKFEETQRDLKKVLSFVQPILFGVIAIVIVVTYLIVLLPIYGMMKGMS